MNISEFSKKIGVSTAAVSYAMNNAGHVSPATREMILTSARELGYRPSHLGRALATKRTKIIALWTYDVYPPYYTHTIHHIRRLLKADGFNFHIVEPSEEASLSNPASWPVDGIIAFRKSEIVEAMTESGGSYPMPLVEVGVNCRKCSDYVEVDTYASSIDAMRHLVGSGRRRIAYLLPSHASESEERCTAYVEVLRESGLDTEFISYDSIADSQDRPMARCKIKEYIQSHGCPDAIFGYDDESAIGAYRGLRDIGVRIPEDVALVGCDGIVDTEYLDPPLTTIVQPVEVMCARAWEFLKNRMADPMIPRQKELLQARLETRGSSGA